MKQLLLIRHGKSSWSDSKIRDRDRPLARRGRIACTLMGSYLADQKMHPDLVLCSDSVRTQESWQKMKEYFAKSKVKVLSSLYHASPKVLLKEICQTPDNVDRLFVIGHNPGMASLARKLPKGKVPHFCKRAYEKFSTAAVAIFECDIDEWQDLKYDSANFRRFIQPKDLV